MVKSIVIAGTHSGVGKTTITVGLIAALRRGGGTVQPFKVGPDYIDPTYHSLAAGRPCRNLDPWMIGTEQVRSLFVGIARTADWGVIEGVMGLFDGLDYEGDTGSTAQVARLLGVPVLLVIDAGKMARSAAALAGGFQNFDRALPLAGFLINRVGSEGHGRGVARAVEKATGLPVLGCLPRDGHLQIGERHLGLIPAAEPGPWQDFIEAAKERVQRHLDLERIHEIGGAFEHRVRGQETKEYPVFETSATGPRTLQMDRPILAVACDEAFHFTYEENLELLRQAGAEITFFSPLHDRDLPAGTSGILLSGGFPEVHASGLAANIPLLEAIRAAHRRQIPIYAECGGLMYLTESIIDQEGRQYPMVGLLPGTSVMGKQLTLGYRQGRAVSDSWLLEKGETVRGHEFHYSCWRERPEALPAVYDLRPPKGNGEQRLEGACLGNLFASYVHLHFWGKPELAKRFVAACRQVESGEKAGVP